MSGTPNQTNGTTPDADISDDLLEQAAIWHARMHDSLQEAASSPAHQQDFAIWLDAAPKNRAAFSEIEHLWGALERPVADILAQRPEVVRATDVDTENSHNPMWQRIISSSRPLAGNGRIGRLRLGLVSVSLALMMGVMLSNITYWNGPKADFETDIGERAPIVLADGSRITLNTDSAMTVDMTPTERRVNLMRGEAWFDVSSADPRPFLVTTQHGLIRVTGTSFDVRVENDTAIVSLTEGRVELWAETQDQWTSPNSPDPLKVESPKELAILLPGEQVALSQGRVSQAIAFDKTALTAWLRGQFVFYNTPLSEVVDTLNRYRPGHVMVLNDSLANLKVSGIFSTNDPNKALDLIADTLPVHLVYLTTYLVIIR